MARPSIAHGGTTVHLRLMASIFLAAGVLGCGTAGDPAATGAGATPPGADPAGFCEAALRLELADSSNRPSIQAALEASTPAGQEDNVAVVREFMERQAAGDDPYQDPDFLLEYDRAVRDLWRHCGRA